MKNRWMLTAACALAALAPASPSLAQTAPVERLPDVIYVPTPPEVVEAMLDMVELKDGDVLYDLGSGDGRIPIAAVKRAKVKATGIDIDPERIAEARANAKAQGVEGKVTFKRDDIFTTDFSDASVVTLYLLNSLNEKLMPRLLQLKPGTRIVSHAFTMGDWKPEKTADIDGRQIFFWTVPAR
ncbi:class I SAM-dependent methyltransferase [Sphingomonas sp. S1-29]|uniref:class I SAM-dependent methyltransferase n=1 Tax=Sphingomonas sp. S1-29 TaxID=2991074 RepID=UPI00223FABD6|nr:class I SAM-dependent methyltransferase [Sphingomonas sp. S1-29]UZK70819.1 class I SAM-dependent methyltransferase [Sphingomonas sp. S1-29]